MKNREHELKNRIVTKKTNWLVMIALLAGLAVGAGSCGQGAAPSDTGVYNAETYDIPWGLALSKDGSTLYTANYLRDNISVYDTSSMTVKYKISTLCKPLYMAFNSDYSLIYLTHDKQDNCTKSQTSFSLVSGAYISVIDVAEKRVIKEISVSSISSAIRDIVYDPNHNVLYALSSSDGKIAIIDAGAAKLANTISYDISVFKPMRIKYDSVKNYLYILDVEKGNIDISTPEDPKNLEFRKIGYNKYKDGYCLGTTQRDGCPCVADANCNSTKCDVTHTLPYCGSIACDPTKYMGEEGAEESCSQKVTTTNCSEVSVEGTSCTGIFSSGVCKYIDKLKLSGGAKCTKNSECISAYGTEYTCNIDSGDCEKDAYNDELCSSSVGCAGWVQIENSTVDCTVEGNECTLEGYQGSTATRCRTNDNKRCEWFIKLSTDAECREKGLMSCNNESGICDVDYYYDSFCDTANGYACDSVDGACRKTEYFDSKCDAALEQTCDTSSGKCTSTVYKDSLCDLEGYLCDRSDGICKIDMYPNGCSCDYDTECVGNEKGTDFCDGNDGVCKTYSSINVSTVGGFCDMRFNDCYDQETAKAYNQEISTIGSKPCKNPTDILLLSDNTAYIACYGISTGSEHENVDPLYRILLNDDSIAHDAKTLVTFKSEIAFCDKPFKIVKDPSEKTALVLCSGTNIIYALDIETGATIKTFSAPKNATDIAISADSFYVSGTTSDKITKYPIPFM